MSSAHDVLSRDLVDSIGFVRNFEVVDKNVSLTEIQTDQSQVFERDIWLVKFYNSRANLWCRRSFTTKDEAERLCDWLENHSLNFQFVSSETILPNLTDEIKPAIIPLPFCRIHHSPILHGATSTSPASTCCT